MGYEYELLERLGENLGVDVELKFQKDLNEMFRFIGKRRRRFNSI